jgi:hypothetical protein
MTFIISIGKYGGFYIHSHRVCLGWIAFTFYKFDIDISLKRLIDHWKFEVKQCKECNDVPFLLIKDFKTFGERIIVSHSCFMYEHLKLPLHDWNKLMTGEDCYEDEE